MGASEKTDGGMRIAQVLAAGGKPVLINAHITTTDFRSGSLSI